jgi:AcrR family transcriptional regulator
LVGITGLLYRIFKDKEEIYQAVFVDWLVSRHPAAKLAAKGPASPYESATIWFVTSILPKAALHPTCAIPLPHNWRL